MNSDTKQLGASGEELAAQFLCQKGYQILARNLKSRYGEIDILARHGDILVIVEVKTKRSISYGLPAEMVNAAKQRKLQVLAMMTAQQHNMVNYRIDVIAIDASRRPPYIEHFISAV